MLPRPRGAGQLVPAALPLPLLCPRPASSLPGLAWWRCGPGGTAGLLLQPRVEHQAALACPLPEPVPFLLSSALPDSWRLMLCALASWGGAFVMVLPIGLTVETPWGLED